jgi:hypothetical protein
VAWVNTAIVSKTASSKSTLVKVAESKPATPPVNVARLNVASWIRHE